MAAHMSSTVCAYVYVKLIIVPNVQTLKLPCPPCMYETTWTFDAHSYTFADGRELLCLETVIVFC